MPVDKNPSRENLEKALQEVVANGASHAAASRLAARAQDPEALAFIRYHQAVVAPATQNLSRLSAQAMDAATHVSLDGVIWRQVQEFDLYVRTKRRHATPGLWVERFGEGRLDAYEEYEQWLERVRGNDVGFDEHLSFLSKQGRVLDAVELAATAALSPMRSMERRLKLVEFAIRHGHRDNGVVRNLFAVTDALASPNIEPGIRERALVVGDELRRSVDDGTWPRTSSEVTVRTPEQSIKSDHVFSVEQWKLVEELNRKIIPQADALSLNRSLGDVWREAIIRSLSQYNTGYVATAMALAVCRSERVLEPFNAQLQIISDTGEVSFRPVDDRPELLRAKLWLELERAWLDRGPSNLNRDLLKLRIDMWDLASTNEELVRRARKIGSGNADMDQGLLNQVAQELITVRQLPDAADLLLNKEHSIDSTARHFAGTSKAKSIQAAARGGEKRAVGTDAYGRPTYPNVCSLDRANKLDVALRDVLHAQTDSKPDREVLAGFITAYVTDRTNEELKTLLLFVKNINALDLGLAKGFESVATNHGEAVDREGFANVLDHVSEAFMTELHGTEGVRARLSLGRSYAAVNAAPRAVEQVRMASVMTGSQSLDISEFNGVFEEIERTDCDLDFVNACVRDVAKRLESPRLLERCAQRRVGSEATAMMREARALQSKLNQVNLEGPHFEID